MNPALPDSFSFDHAAEILRVSPDKLTDYLGSDQWINQNLLIPRSMLERIAATEGIKLN